MANVHIRGRISCGLFLAAAAVMTAAPVAPARAAESTNATFVAHYAANVPSDVRAAVDFATTIWSQRLQSTVPIEVDVDWGVGLPQNVASSSEPLGYEPVANGTLQPVELANALAGRDLEPGVSDIHLLLGTGTRWYTGLDGHAPANATDLVTMVLHELTHGLGFAESFRLAGGGLTWGRGGLPVGLDAGLFDTATGSLVKAQSPADALASATSRRIVWRGTARDSHGHAPVMYAPAGYEPNSSLCHFDDDAYPQGDPDALMTSLIRRGEVIHRIGPAALGVLHDLGWTVNDEPADAAAPATARPGVVASKPASPASAPTPTTAPPVVPAHFVARRAAAADVGRTGITGIGAAVPMLVVALGWRLRRSVRG